MEIENTIDRESTEYEGVSKLNVKSDKKTNQSVKLQRLAYNNNKNAKPSSASRKYTDVYSY